MESSRSASSSAPRSPKAPAPAMTRRGSFSGLSGEESSKQWVQVVGPDGEETRVRVERTITTTELRKAVKTRVGIPIKELELKVAGEILQEGVAQPLANLSDDKLVIYWEQLDRLKSLLAYRKLRDINGIGKFDRSALHFAVLDGDPDLCKDIIFSKDLKDGTINRRDIFQDSPLMLASILGYLEIVEVLVDRQANVEYQNLCGRTALQMAAEHGHDRVVKALLAEDGNMKDAPPRLGPLGLTNVSKSAPYLARLNQRYMVLHRIKLHKISKQVQPGLDF